MKSIKIKENNCNIFKTILKLKNKFRIYLKKMKNY